ncbi:hypothetical protein ERJ75_001442600 [Trypanosoma vivax]|nr:hypothetical protein ERJ75_001442600 [Trypanosoma vivax]
MYAHDSVETVNVSGMTNPSFRKYFCHSFALYAGSDTADNRKRKEGKKKAMGTRPTTLAGPTKMPIQCRIEECTLAGLVDAVTCSLYHRTALKEDMLILATSVGEVRFYSIPITTRRVVVPHAVVRPHEKRINKMCIYYSCSALLTASDDGLVKMISLDSGALLRTFPSAGAQPHAAVHDFDVNPKLRLIVTVGPERHGVVWDFSHDAPMATLDSHNGPCCCCCMSVRQKQIVTVGVDGSVFIFDTQGFRLMQIINVDRLNPQRVMFDKSELRLLCLATYPYFHGRNHHAALSYSTKYKGHMAPMVGVLYNRAYDMIVTIDTEGLVMMWKRATGAAAFTFQLKDFSDSAVMNAARLTCFALDGLERRLLTGFHNGVTAVWNLMNGQTTNVITAAAENFNTSCPNPEVTALGTLTRDGITFFIFASAGRLYTTRESSIFTIASANKWEIPTSLGDVVSILPVSPYCIACGTSYGAMFFYRVMAGRQEGSALWVIESTESIRRSLNFQTLDGRRDQPASFLTSRIIKIFPLQAVGPHIFMAVHMDGTVVLWHTLRRLMMSTLNVRSALAQKGTEQSLSHVEVDHENEYLIFADNHSNIHVCSMEFCPVHDDVDTETLRVPVLQTTEGSQMACWPGSPFDRDVIARDIQMREERKKERERETSPMGSASRARDQDGRSGNVSEKTQYTFVRFFRECVFHSGFNSLSGLSLLDSSDEGVETSENALSEFIPQQDMVKEVEQSANELGTMVGAGFPIRLQGVGNLIRLR